MHITRRIGSVIDTYTEVKGLQGIACDAVDLALQERTESRVHRETASVAVSEIHACGQHRYCQFASFLD